MSFRRILIAVDGEPIAAHAADVGVKLARSLGADVALVHAIDTSAGYGAETGISPNELIDQAKQDGKRLLEAFRQRLSLQPVGARVRRCREARDEIVKAAGEWPGDLIVIGSHGRGGMQRALLGSVAEGVMRHACCPVLVIRAKE